MKPNLKYIFLIILPFMLGACGGGESNETPQSELIGSWVTEKCTQQTNPQGNPQAIWDIGKYRFTSAGSLFFQILTYDNSNCIGQELSIIDWPLIPTDGIQFEVQGTELTSSGVIAHRVSFYVQNFQGSIQEHQYFIHIENDRLCKSSGLILEPNDFGFSSELSIDFVNCLNKII